ncbi:chromatin-modulating protein mrc1, variant 2 [Chamberlinius hualienensis]
MMFSLFVSSILLFTISSTEAAAIQQIPTRLKVDGDIIELTKSEESWLKMLLIFNQNRQNTNFTKLIEEVNTTTAAPTTTTTAPIKIDCITLGNHCFHFSDTKLSWQGAFDSCKNKGAKLAYPMNAEENTLLATHLLKLTNGTSTWFFGGKRNSGGGWVFSHDNSYLQYTNWHPGSPVTNNATNTRCESSSQTIPSSITT